MKSPKRDAICILCGEPTSFLVAFCPRCGYRLPWANKVEGIEEEKRPGNVSSKPSKTLKCRYCNEPIEVDAKQCPHCEEWLTDVFHVKELDVWEPDYKDKNLARVDTIRPRGGCVTAFPLFLVVMLILLWK